MVLPTYAGKVDFIRDSVALVIVISAVVTVAFDGVVGYGLQVYFSCVLTLFLSHSYSYAHTLFSHLASL